MPNKKKLPTIKKDIRTFLNSEEGKITKKNALRVGISISFLGFFLGQIANAAHTSCWPPSNHSSHSSCGADCPADDTSDDSSYNGGDNGDNTSYDHTYLSGVLTSDLNGHENTYYINYQGTVRASDNTTADGLHQGTVLLGNNEPYGNTAEHTTFDSEHYNGVEETVDSGVFSGNDCYADYVPYDADNPCPDDDVYEE